MLLLGATDVAELLDERSCIDAVEAAFAAHARGLVGDPAICGVHVSGGGFHVKAAAQPVGANRRAYFAAKTNANFPSNPRLHGLPTIQGVLVLFDASCGVPLALMESAEITVRRTAAATAVAARRLAAPTASTLALVGCGRQGVAHIGALCAVRPIERILAFDRDPAAIDRLIPTVRARGIDVDACADVEAARDADIWVTCTTSQEYVLHAKDVRPGAFVAGVGVDNPGKRELAPDLVAGSTVIVDSLTQCASIGDLHHAIEAGSLDVNSVHADLGQVIAGLRPGRRSAEETIVFDSTGTALQDVAAAALVYERALEAGHGTEVRLV